jgi:hypothetical protein
MSNMAPCERASFKLKQSFGAMGIGEPRRAPIDGLLLARDEPSRALCMYAYAQMQMYTDL